MIFVLGANGFVGSAFVRRLSNLNLPFIPVTRTNYTDYVGHPCRILINASGNSRKYLATREPAHEFDLSVTSVLRAICDFRPARYVHLSSIDVYNDVSNPTNNCENVSIDPAHLSAYGFSKYMAELVVKHYAPNWLILRLGGMVGPGLKKNPIYDLLHGGSLYVHPDSLYQYVSTDRVAEIVFDLAQSNIRGEVFNLCGDTLISPRQVAGWLQRPDA